MVLIERLSHGKANDSNQSYSKHYVCSTLVDVHCQ
jgi:hypothetical protein